MKHSICVCVSVYPRLISAWLSGAIQLFAGVLWASPYAQLPDKSQTAIVARVAGVVVVVFAFGVAKRMRRYFG